MYKILAKILAERLKKVIPSVISVSQSAFIEGKQIIDPILIAKEMVEEYTVKKKKGWILELDIEKAFDRLICTSRKCIKNEAILFQMYSVDPWMY